MKRRIFFVLVFLVVALASALPTMANVHGGSGTIHVPPTPRPTPSPKPIPALPKPGHPHYSTDPHNCVKNGGSGDFCAQLKTGKYIAIFWPWSCTGSNCGLGGFHVWLAGTHPKAIDATPNRVVITNTPRTGTCYYVTAYPSPISHAAESKPSEHTCIHATFKTVTVKPHITRGYTRQYWVLYSDNNPQVKTSPPGSRSPLIVGGQFDSTNQSQVNTFMRAAYEFDLSSIAGNSVFGGSFAYDLTPYDPTHSCAELHKAPSGWQSASWIAPTDRPLSGKFAKSGKSLEWPIDGLIKSWSPSNPLPLFLEEVYGVGPAEFIKSGIVPYSFTCESTINNPRLMIKVGITV